MKASEQEILDSDQDRELDNDRPKFSINFYQEGITYGKAIWRS